MRRRSTMVGTYNAVIISESEESPGLVVLYEILRSASKASLEDDRGVNSFMNFRLTSLISSITVILSEREESPGLVLLYEIPWPMV